jgi:hypothetical protein
MRRLFTLLTALGLASTLLGCHHTCGICDCDKDNDPCTYYAPSDHAAMPAPIAGTTPLATAAPNDPGNPVMQKVMDK